MTRRTTLYLLVLAWMALIFWFSSAGSEVSTGQSDGVIGAIQAATGVELPEKLVRKAAHAAVYFVLGVLLVLLVRTYDVRLRRAAVLAVALAGLYACSDELHQMVVPGRSAEVGDVLLDTAAASVGVGLYVLVARARSRTTRGTEG